MSNTNQKKKVYSQSVTSSTKFIIFIIWDENYYSYACIIRIFQKNKKKFFLPLPATSACTRTNTHVVRNMSNLEVILFIVVINGFYSTCYASACNERWERGEKNENCNIELVCEWLNKFKWTNRLWYFTLDMFVRGWHWLLGKVFGWMIWVFATFLLIMMQELRDTCLMGFEPYSLKSFWMLIFTLLPKLT